MKLDLNHRIHVLSAESRYLDDVRSDSSDRHVMEKSDLAAV